MIKWYLDIWRLVFWHFTGRMTICMKLFIGTLSSFKIYNIEKSSSWMINLENSLHFLHQAMYQCDETYFIILFLKVKSDRGWCKSRRRFRIYIHIGIVRIVQTAIWLFDGNLTSDYIGYKKILYLLFVYPSLLTTPTVPFLSCHTDRMEEVLPQHNSYF